MEGCMNQERDKGSKTILTLMIITAITKVFGFFREIVMGRLFGIGDVTEAFRIAQTIPMMLLLVVGTGISTGFIPIYTKLKKEEGAQRANAYAANLINILILFGIGFSLVVTLFPSAFVTLFAGGFTGDKLELTIHFTRIAVWGMVFNMVVYVLMPFLQIYDDYMTPALMVIPGNLVFILCFFLGKSIHLDLVAISVILSALIQSLWLIPASKKKGFKVRRDFDFSDPAFIRLLTLAAPVIIGVAVNQINVIVDRNIASTLVDGGVSALEYANKMNTFAQNIFIYPVAAVFFPQVTKMISESETDKARQMTHQSLIILALITIPAMAGLMVFSYPIIETVFGGGAFGSRAVQMTGSALIYYALGLFWMAWRDISIRIFYSKGDTRTPTINAIIGVILNIVLNIILSQVMGLNGLALATSISAMVSSLLMLWGVGRFKDFRLPYKMLFNRLAKILLATLVMALGSSVVFRLLSSLSVTIALLAAITVAVSLYVLSIILLRIPEFRALMSLFKRKSKSVV